jgi:hypothetical protein
MRTVTVGLALALIAFAAVPARAGLPGSLFITPEQVDTSNTDFEKSLKQKAVHSIEKGGDQWTLYFVAFLKKAPGAKEVQLVFYDTGVKGHEPTNNFPIETQSNAKILSSSVSFGPDQGFKAGHTYHVLITRLIGGKEEVYARSEVTLK